MWRWIAVAVLGFLLMVLARAPARWVQDKLPPRIHCASLLGTVWNGRCNGLAIDQAVAGRAPLAIDSMQWNLHPLPLLRGSVAADVKLWRGDGEATAQVQRGLGGALEVRALNGQLAVDRALLPPLPAGWQAEVAFRDVAFALDGNLLTRLTGSGRLVNVTDTRGSSLGSYELDFGQEPHDAPFNGRLRSLDGPVKVDAAVVLAANTGWEMNGTVIASATAPASLERMLAQLGPPDAAGRRTFSISAEP